MLYKMLAASLHVIERDMLQSIEHDDEQRASMST
jgi:hypothetical protein